MIDNARLGPFREILEVIRWEFPNSHPVIGGGALRDSILNRPVKDVDVFLRAKDHTSLDSTLTKYVQPPVIVAHGYGRADLHGCWNFQQQLCGYDVQLILADFNDLIDLATSFDIGLCRVTYDGTTLHASDDFKQDAADKTFRIRRADNHYEVQRSLRRVERLRAKYPEFLLERPVLSRCPACRTDILAGTFRNPLSVKEYGISGLCQNCQDSVFGAD